MIMHRIRITLFATRCLPVCAPIRFGLSPTLALVLALISTMANALPLQLGAEQIEHYLPLVKGKRVGVVTNASARIDSVSVMDRLALHGVVTTLVLTPEHGYDLSADAGEAVGSQQLPWPVLSLYGQHKQPPAEVMKTLDVMLFDLQDVGVRAFTYISTLHYVMEACAEAGVPLVVLDRPNPNGDRIDGPVLEPAYRSFVGLHPIPFLHGLTVAELARMISGERWLQSTKPLTLSVISVQHYRHDRPYTPTLPPSPNLPNQHAIRLYPSLVWFEATPLSIGRGTDFPFQVIGSTLPTAAQLPFTFTPMSRVGAKSPVGQDQLHHGVDLRRDERASLPTQTHADSHDRASDGMQLQWLLDWHQRYREANAPFFTAPDFFDKLAGTRTLRLAIARGDSEAQIRASWQPALADYRKRRERYLLYP